MSEAKKRGRPRLSEEERQQRAHADAARRQERERRDRAKAAKIDASKKNALAIVDRVSARLLATDRARREREAAADAELAARKRLARGKGKKARIELGLEKATKTERVIADDGSLQNVEVRPTFSMRGLEPHQRAAAERFERDWRAAFQEIKSPSLEMAVDGGRGGADDRHVRSLQAQARLDGLRREVADFALLEAAVIHGAGPEKLHKAGGAAIVAITDRIKRALNRVSAFYGGPEGRPDRTIEAAQRWIQEAERQAEGRRG